MKQYLDSVQNAILIDLGFPSPKSVSKLTLDIDMDTIPTFSYSIGELIGFLPPNIYDEDEDVVASLQITSGWEVYYTTYSDIFYYVNNKELIDALFDMCIILKKKGLI